MTFDDVLNTSLDSASKVLRPNYAKLTAHKNLTSYSTQDLFHSCPRKFAIKKLQSDSGNHKSENSVTFSFGHAVGAGVALYDATQDLRAAIWEAFRAWDMDLLDTEYKPGKKRGKSFWEAIWALYKYAEFYQEIGLDQYESVKIEANVAIDFEDGHYYSGHIDEILRHRVSGQYLVKENKTTGITSIDPAMYANSDQALSYAVVVDMLGGTNYEVLYTVYSSSGQEWSHYHFVKQGHKKGEWIQDQLLLHQQIESYQELNFFPKRGRSCMNFMRRCEYFETCDLGTDTVFNKKFSELPAIKSFADIQSIESLDFAITLTDIINRQKEKLNEL